MKTKIIIIVIATILLSFNIVNAESNNGKSGVYFDQYYPTCGIVTELDGKNDTVTFTDGAGNEWKFYGIEDYMIGDLVAVIMDSMETLVIYDDEIVAVRYAGTFENWR